MNIQFREDIVHYQNEDPFIAEEKKRIAEGKKSLFQIKDKDTLYYQDRICVPDIAHIKEVILREAHDTLFNSSW